MKWPLTTWSEVLDIKNGKSQKNVVDPEGLYPIFGSGGQMGYANDYLCEPGTTIIGRKGSINSPIFVREKFWNVDTAFGLCPKESRLNDRFLYHFCIQYNFLKHNKATTLPSLTKSDLLEIQIPLPPLAEQKRIAAILDKAYAIRRKLQQSLRLSDDFLRSVFLDMFGDPVTNPKGWDDSCVLGEVAEIVSGVTKGRKLDGKSTREIPYLAVANVQDKRLNLATVKTVPATSEEIQKYKLIKNDLLLTEGGDPDKLGRGTLWYDELPECIHQNHIFRVRLSHPEVHPVFLNWLVGSERGKKYFLRSAKQTTGIASINMTQLRAFPMLMPPLLIQKRFAEIIQAVAKKTTRLTIQSRNAGELFFSLQQRAFRGDL